MSVRLRLSLMAAAAVPTLMFAVRQLDAAPSSHAKPPTEAGPSVLAAAAPSEPTVAALAAARRWQVGRRFTYAVEHDVRLGDGFEGPTIRLHGKLAVTTANVDDSGVQLLLDFEPQRVEPAALAERQAELSQPFVLHASREGTLRGVRFHPSVAADTRRLLRGLVGVVQSTVRQQQTWNALETDSGGEYRAVYARKGDAELNRRHESYVRLATESGLEPIDVVESHAVDAVATFVLDDDQQVRELSSVQKLRMVAFQGGDEIRVHTATTLRDRNTEQVSIDASAWDALEAAVSLADDTGSREPEQRAADESIVAGAQLDDIVGAALALQEMPSEKEARTEASRLFSQLGALARLEPSTVDMLHDLLADPEPYGSLAQSVLIGGLGSAGTPKARKALTDLLDADVPKERRNSIIIALHQQSETSSETAQRMLEEAQGSDPAVSDQALLALGSMTRTLPEGSEVDTLQGVLDAWTQDGDTSRRAIVLDALGNSADPRALPLLERTLREPTSALEDRAVYAMRGMDDVRSRELLAGLLSDEAPEALRLAALDAMQYRPDLPSFEDALAALEQRSVDPQVRERSAHLLERMPR